jgi:hypothetical protein
MKRLSSRSVFAAIIALIAGLLVPAVAAGPAAASPVPGTKGSYAAPVKEPAPRADGKIHIDTAATISRLQAMNANTYAYLVWTDPTQWPDFVNEFMPAAQAAGINVWIYLTPPSEGGTAQWGTDYVQAAEDIATVRASYSHLKAMAIDDFNANTGTFAPSYLASMHTAANAVTSGLDIYATVYYSAMTSSFASTYNPQINGYIFPFRDEPNTNTQWVASASSQVDTYASIAGAGRVFLMPYASKLSSAVFPPDVNYVSAVTSVGIAKMNAGTIAGVIEYALPLTPGAGNGATNRAHTGVGSIRVTVPPNKQTSAGQWASANTTVTLDAGSSSCSIVAYNSDNIALNVTPGYHFKRIGINSHVAWERDVSTDGTGWYTNSPANLTPYLVNGSGTLSLLVYEKKGVYNYQLDVSFDDITLTGCHIANSTMESPTGWWFSRSAGTNWVCASVTRYDADYSSAVLDAVAALYA